MKTEPIGLVIPIISDRLRIQCQLDYPQGVPREFSTQEGGNFDVDTTYVLTHRPSL